MAQRTPGFRMWCLGGFRCETGNAEPFNFGTNKARALLVYLAVEAPRSFRRSHLAGLLWSEYSEKNALHNLRQTLLRVSKGWPKSDDHPPLLLKIKDTVAINPEVDLWVDLLAFEAVIDRAVAFYEDRQHLERLDIHSLITAVNLFSGPFLERFRLFDSLLFNEWASLVWERTTKKALEAKTLLCEYYERRGDYAQAGYLAEKIAALVPWSNQACAHGMRLYAVQKQWAPAARHYEQFRQYLAANLSVEPSPSLTELYHDIRTLSNQDQALAHSIPVIENQVPEPTSSFIGRETEIGDLSAMLADPQNRLVTVVGKGGTGKTRLAIAMGHLIQGLYAQGAFFIPLRDVSSLEGLGRLMEERLNCSFSGTTSHRRQLLDFLRERNCLLILDGCEHFLLRNPIRDMLFEILSSAPEVKILATSRECLNLQGEHVYPLVGLDYHVDECHELEGQSSDAVALFTDRARQVNRQFTVNEDSLPLLQTLCMKVEGHPLSIELMAPATATLTISDLLDDLNTSQNAFDPTMSALPGEGCALSIVIERSWQLSSETQRSTLIRLVSFKGGFTEAAATHIAQTTTQILFSLVDKSFIHQISPKRFALHEIIQEYALQKATKRGQLAPTRETHAGYYVAFLESLAGENRSNIRAETLNEIEADLENILSAWGYFIEKDQIKKLENCIDILFQYFNVRSLFEEGISLFQNAIHSANYLAPFDPLLGMLVNRLGSLAQRMRQNKMAFQMFTRAQAIFKDQEESSELGLSLIGLGNYHMRVKEFDRALSYTRRALDSFRALGDHYHEGTALYLLGMIYQRSADYPTAKQMMTEALEISRDIGDQRGMIARLNQLAGHDCNQGDFEVAEERYLESLALSRVFKDRYQQAIILNNLASVYHPWAAYEKEQSVLEESLAICREIGDLDGEAIALNNLGELAVVLGDHNQALKYCRTALDIALRLGEDWTIIAVYDILGCAYLGLGDHTTAYQCLQQAIRIAYQIQSWDLLTRSLVNLAEVHLAGNEVDAAKELLGAALAHPSILYEYGLKAVDLYAGIGATPPVDKDARVLMEVLQRRSDLTPPKA